MPPPKLCRQRFQNLKLALQKHWDGSTIRSPALLSTGLGAGLFVLFCFPQAVGSLVLEILRVGLRFYLQLRTPTLVSEILNYEMQALTLSLAQVVQNPLAMLEALV